MYRPVAQAGREKQGGAKSIVWESMSMKLPRLLTACVFCALCAQSRGAEKPNIVLLFADDAGYGDWKMLRYPDRPAELFDVVRDPGEQNNLATRHRETIEMLYKKLFAWELTLERPLFQLRRQEEGWSSRRRDEFGKPPLESY